jgi:SAM-dependent methyltransferase
LEVERETRRYYDLERGREDRPLDPRRVEARTRFVEATRAAGDRARPVVEIGTGPGRDALVLAAAGLDVIGVDVSPGHAARAASRGVERMVVASARALPFASGSIGALWSMSTLMHIPDAAIEQAMREIGRVLAPGAIVAIGVWGGPDVEHLSGGPDGSPGPRRLFSRRSEPRWRSLLELVGRIDVFEVWRDEAAAADDADDDAFRYDLAFLTAHGSSRPA